MSFSKIERLKIFRKSLNLTQVQFCEALQLDQSYYSKVESGKIECSISVLEKIYDIYGINIHWYLTGDGNMYNDCPPNSVHLIEDSVHLNSVQSKNNILVPVAAYGGYLGEWTQEYISQELIYIKVPGEPHHARTFEISGDSMEPVISHGDYVVCRQTEHIDQIKKGRIYVIVSSLSGITVKYVYPGTDFIVLEPANLTSHSATQISHEEIKEVWEVVLRITSDIKTTEDEPVRSRIATIERFLYKQNPNWKGV